MLEEKRRFLIALVWLTLVLVAGVHDEVNRKNAAVIISKLVDLFLSVRVCAPPAAAAA